MEPHLSRRDSRSSQPGRAVSLGTRSQFQRPWIIARPMPYTDLRADAVAAGGGLASATQTGFRYLVTGGHKRCRRRGSCRRQPNGNTAREYQLRAIRRSLRSGFDAGRNSAGSRCGVFRGAVTAVFGHCPDVSVAQARLRDRGYHLSSGPRAAGPSSRSIVFRSQFHERDSSPGTETRGEEGPGGSPLNAAS